jgi:hypothetical protein
MNTLEKGGTANNNKTNSKSTLDRGGGKTIKIEEEGSENQVPILENQFSSKGGEFNSSLMMEGEKKDSIDEEKGDPEDDDFESSSKPTQVRMLDSQNSADREFFIRNNKSNFMNGGFGSRKQPLTQISRNTVTTTKITKPTSKLASSHAIATVNHNQNQKMMKENPYDMSKKRKFEELQRINEETKNNVSVFKNKNKGVEFSFILSGKAQQLAQNSRFFKESYKLKVDNFYMSKMIEAHTIGNPEYSYTSDCRLKFGNGKYEDWITYKLYNMCTKIVADNDTDGSRKEKIRVLKLFLLEQLSSSSEGLSNGGSIKLLPKKEDISNPTKLDEWIKNFEQNICLFKFDLFDSNELLGFLYDYGLFPRTKEAITKKKLFYFCFEELLAGLWIAAKLALSTSTDKFKKDILGITGGGGGDSSSSSNNLGRIIGKENASSLNSDQLIRLFFDTVVFPDYDNPNQSFCYHGLLKGDDKAIETLRSTHLASPKFKEPLTAIEKLLKVDIEELMKLVVFVNSGQKGGVLFQDPTMRAHGQNTIAYSHSSYTKFLNVPEKMRYVIASSTPTENQKIAETDPSTYYSRYNCISEEAGTNELAVYDQLLNAPAYQITPFNKEKTIYNKWGAFKMSYQTKSFLKESLLRNCICPTTQSQQQQLQNGLKTPPINYAVTWIGFGAPNEASFRSEMKKLTVVSFAVNISFKTCLLSSDSWKSILTSKEGDIANIIQEYQKNNSTNIYASSSNRGGDSSSSSSYLKVESGGIANNNNNNSSSEFSYKDSYSTTPLALWIYSRMRTYRFHAISKNFKHFS